MDDTDIPQNFFSEFSKFLQKYNAFNEPENIVAYKRICEKKMNNLLPILVFLN